MKYGTSFPTKLSILEHLRTLPAGTRIRLDGIRSSNYALIIWKRQEPYMAVQQNGDTCKISLNELLQVLWSCRSVLKSPSTFIGPLPLPKGPEKAYHTKERACLAHSLEQAQTVLGPEAKLITCPGDDLYFRNGNEITSILREAAKRETSHA